MADSTINTNSIATLRPISPVSTPSSAPGAVVGKEFKAYLLESLEKVNRLQTEADEGVQKLVTGQTDNVAEVLTATRKAGIAFDLLMEIRNKLMDAYTELRQMRV